MLFPSLLSFLSCVYVDENVVIPSPYLLHKINLGARSIEHYMTFEYVIKSRIAEVSSGTKKDVSRTSLSTLLSYYTYFESQRCLFQVRRNSDRAVR